MSDEGTPRPVDAEDPESFSFQYELKKKMAVLRARLFEEDALRRSLTPQARLNKLQDAVTRGKDARRLLASEFWARDVEPFLKAEAVLKPWDPKAEGPFAFMKLVAAYVFGSGQARVLVHLMETLYRWQREGDAAEKQLLAEAEKRKRADAAKSATEAARR